MTRAQPSPAISWLIEELAKRDIRANPPKIERLQSVGLAPRPLHHRSDTLRGEALWPQGALAHYGAVVPLVRQRHASTEIAAITLIGWGFPVDIGLLKRSYAKAYSFGDLEDRADDLLAHYQNRGMSMFKNALTHVRSHGLANGLDATDLADEMIHASLSYTHGSARTEQIRLMLAAGLPKYGQAQEAVIDWVVWFFDQLQTEFSLPKLIEIVSEASADDLLRVQPTAAKELDTDIEHLGGFSLGCQDCNETRGYMIGLAIPIHFRIESLDWAPLLDELASCLPEDLVT